MGIEIVDGPKSRIVNNFTSMPLTDVQTKLNPHIEKMNSEGWELFAIIQQAIGIHELLLLFWRKTV